MDYSYYNNSINNKPKSDGKFSLVDGQYQWISDSNIGEREASSVNESKGLNLLNDIQVSVPEIPGSKSNNFSSAPILDATQKVSNFASSVPDSTKSSTAPNTFGKYGGAGVGIASSVAGITGDMIAGNSTNNDGEPDKAMNIGGSALSYAGTGASMGMMFGPVGAGIGAGVGALVGGGLGLMKNNAEQRAYEVKQREEDKDAAFASKQRQNRLNNYKAAFAV